MERKYILIHKHMMYYQKFEKAGNWNNFFLSYYFTCLYSCIEFCSVKRRPYIFHVSIKTSCTFWFIYHYSPFGLLGYFCPSKTLSLEMMAWSIEKGRKKRSRFATLNIILMITCKSNLVTIEEITQNFGIARSEYNLIDFYQI